MNSHNFAQWFVPAMIGGYFLWRIWKNWRMRKLVPEYLKGGALLIDVRSPSEFSLGHHPESLNVPLLELEKKIATMDKSRMVVLCCASGMRSGMALGILKRHGFKQVVNAGAWTNTLPENEQKPSA
jgi:rhodanese-related sulfurtransferase